MPEPFLPEDEPPPKPRRGRKRGRRPAGAAAPTHPTAEDVPAALPAPGAVSPVLLEQPDAEPAVPPGPDAETAQGTVAATEHQAPGVPAAAAAARGAAAEATAPAEPVEAPEESQAAEEAPVLPETDEGPPPAAPERGLATIMGGPVETGRPTWMDVPPERIGPLLAAFADEGARLLALTVLPAVDPEPPDVVALRYHFVVSETPITVSTRTPRRAAPSAAGLFPAMTWRERELVGEYGLRFVDPPLEVDPPMEQGIGNQESPPDENPADAPLLISRPPTADP